MTPGSSQTRQRAGTSYTHRLRGLAVTGFIATLAAMVATTLAAALARAVGVDFEVPDGGETIPVSGIAVVTGFFSVVGVVMAAALLRWSARPAERFVWTAVSLTAISLVPPLLSGAEAATVTALIGLHLVAAAVMIPTLSRSLRDQDRLTIRSGASGSPSAGAVDPGLDLADRQRDRVAAELERPGRSTAWPLGSVNRTPTVLVAVMS